MAKEPLIRPYVGKFSTILLFGPPGAGKGSLAKFLASAGTQYQLSSGEIFRTLPIDSPAGKLYQHYASRGLLIPDDAVIEIWKYYVQGLIATNSYNPESQDLLLHGMPRTRQQAEMLSEFIHVRHVIVLDVSDPEALKRRMILKARLEGRLDEIHESALNNRLEEYAKQAEQILNYYPKHLMSIVDGNQKLLEVLRDVLVRLSHLLSHGPGNHVKNGEPL